MLLNFFLLLCSNILVSTKSLENPMQAWGCLKSPIISLSWTKTFWWSVLYNDQEEHGWTTALPFYMRRPKGKSALSGCCLVHVCRLSIFEKADHVFYTWQDRKFQNPHTTKANTQQPYFSYILYSVFAKTSLKEEQFKDCCQELEINSRKKL